LPGGERVTVDSSFTVIVLGEELGEGRASGGYGMGHQRQTPVRKKEKYRGKKNNGVRENEGTSKSSKGPLEKEKKGTVEGKKGAAADTRDELSGTKASHAGKRRGKRVLRRIRGGCARRFIGAKKGIQCPLSSKTPLKASSKKGCFIIEKRKISTLLAEGSVWDDGFGKKRRVQPGGRRGAPEFAPQRPNRAKEGEFEKGSARNTDLVYRATTSKGLKKQGPGRALIRMTPECRAKKSGKGTGKRRERGVTWNARSGGRGQNTGKEKRLP